MHREERLFAKELVALNQPQAREVDPAVVVLQIGEVLLLVFDVLYVVSVEGFIIQLRLDGGIVFPIEQRLLVDVAAPLVP